MTIISKTIKFDVNDKEVLLVILEEFSKSLVRPE
jgi:hypothetical protein